MNRTLVEMARCLLRQGKMPPMFWAEAINTAAYIRNRCVSQPLKGTTPHSIFKKKKPTLTHFKIFGCKAFVLNKTQKGKFDSRAEECIFVGYSTESKAYRLWNPVSRKLIISRDVKFMNSFHFMDLDDNFEDFCDDKKEDERNVSEDSSMVEVRTDLRTEKSKRPMRRPTYFRTRFPSAPLRRKPGRPRIHRTGSVGRPKKIYAYEEEEMDGPDTQQEVDNDVFEDESVAMTEVEVDEFVHYSILSEPETWEEAAITDDAVSWKAALEDEFLSLIYNETWEMVDRPTDRKIIKNRLVFRTKQDGIREKKKVRLVAKGYSQLPGIDFTETYSPVVKATSIRLMAALAAEKGLIIHQMDVVTAYLNGHLEEKIYMDVPVQLEAVLEKIITGEPVGLDAKIIEDEKIISVARRWIKVIKKKEDCVCLLTKALYGLKQSGLQWYKRLKDVLLKMGLNLSSSDPCLFFINHKEKILLVTIYVDDILIASNNLLWINHVKETLSKCFRMKDLGRVNKCLGIDFHQNEDDYSITLSQSDYVDKLLERFGMTDCKPANTPIETKCTLTRPEIIDEQMMREIPYQSLIGGLLYLAISTRPDIAFAVSFLSQFNSFYNQTHWKAAKRVLRYLKGTKNYQIRYVRNGEELHGFVDADWASNLLDRHSFTGYAFIYASSPISWETRKQRTAALSTTDAELMGISDATREAIFLKNLMKSIGLQLDSITLWNDSQSAQSRIKNPTTHSRSKHMEVRRHFIKEIIDEGFLKLEYISTHQMPADILTKGLTHICHMNCLSMLGIKIL